MSEQMSSVHGPGHAGRGRWRRAAAGGWWRRAAAVVAGVSLPLAVSMTPGAAWASPDGTDYQVVATIGVGQGPSAIAIDPGLQRAFVADNDGTIPVIDTSADAVVDQDNEDYGLTGAAVATSTHTVYLTGGGFVVQMDATNDSIEGELAAGDTPWAAGADPQQNVVYVANAGDGTVSVLDNPDGNDIGDVPVGDDPTAVAADPPASQAFVAVTGDDRVAVVGATHDTAGSLADITVGQSPDAVAVDDGTNTAYAANGADGTVSVIDGSAYTVTATIGVGSDPDGIAADPVTHTVYVANAGDGTVSIIDGTTGTVTDTVQVGNDPTAVAVDPQTGMAFVTNGGDGTVSVIAPAGSVPTTTAVSPSDPNPQAGEQVTWTATVTAGTGIVPGGTVSFSGGGGPIGGCQDVNLSSAAPYTATCQQTYQDTGGQTVTASYSGDAATAASSGQGQADVVPAYTTTTVSGPESVPVAQQASWTATATADDGGLIPGGTVSFSLDGTALTACQAAANGSSCGIDPRPSQLGSHRIEADYGGDASTQPSEGTIDFFVVKDTSVTTVTPSANPIGPTDSVSFTAQVSNATVPRIGPNGAVQFAVNGVPFGSPVKLNRPAEAQVGTAQSPAIAGLARGADKVTATYLGDSFLGRSTGAVAEDVECGQTITGTVGQPLTVSSGVTCVIGGTIDGGITAASGAALYLQNATVNPYKLGRGGFHIKAPGTVVVSGLTGIRICGSTMIQLEVTGTTGQVLIGASGSPDVTCAGDTITGNVNETAVRLANNRLTVELENTAVTARHGNVFVEGNHPQQVAPRHAIVISGNTITGDLGCSSNNPIPTDNGVPNTVGGLATGQCKRLT